MQKFIYHKKTTKALQLCPGASNPKSETTLFTQTLKTYKVVLDFEAQGEGYGCFIIFKAQFHF